MKKDLRGWDMLKKLHHICLVSSNYQETIKFYVETLGFEIFRESFSSNWNGQKLELYYNGEYMLEIFVVEDDNRKKKNEEVFTGLNHLSFLVDDVENVINKLRSKNIETSEVKLDNATGKKYAFFYDPDGIKLEIYES
jgi:glyoxylase I family protein